MTGPANKICTKRRATMKAFDLRNKGITTKRRASWIALGGLLATLVLGVPTLRERSLGIVPKLQAQDNDAQARDNDPTKGCSVATLSGIYGFYRTGTTPVGPLAAVGFITFDGRGSFTNVHQTIRRNGVTTSDLFTSSPLKVG
jgi:hypothetical protein